MKDYISLGRQLQHDRRLTLHQFNPQLSKAVEMALHIHQSLKKQGFVAGMHDEMILGLAPAAEGAERNVRQYMTSPPSWNDTALEALLADVRRQETEITQPWFSPDLSAMEARVVAAEVEKAITYDGSYMRCMGQVRQAVEVDTLVPGDRIFMSGCNVPREVLYIHKGTVCVTLLVISSDSAIPFTINRHKGGVIYKEAN